MLDVARKKTLSVPCLSKTRYQPATRNFIGIRFNRVALHIAAFGPKKITTAPISSIHVTL